MQTLKLTKKYEKYTEYKDSGVEWLGKIPADWELQKLKNNFSFEKGKKAAIFTQEYINNDRNIGEFPVYSGQTENNGVMGKINSFEYDFSDPVVFTTTVGAKAMTPLILNGKFNLSQNCLLMVPKGDIDSRFFYYQLFSLFRKMKDEIPSHMQPSLRVSDVNKASVAYTSKHNQIKIANYLDEKTSLIDQIIEKKQKLIELLKEKRSAVINNAVTKGLDPKVELIESGIDWIGKIPKGWSTEKLKNRTVFLNGYSFDSDTYVQDGLPIIRISDVGQEVDFSQVKRVPFELRQKISKFLVKKNDLLVALTGGTIGKTSIYDKNEEIYLNQRVGIVRPNENLDLNFLKHQIDSNIFKKNIELFCIGGAQPNIGKNEIGNIIFPFPSKDQQVKIASYLDKKTSLFNQSITEIERSIQLLQEFKSSLISNTVTGKIKIN